MSHSIYLIPHRPGRPHTNSPPLLFLISCYTLQLKYVNVSINSSSLTFHPFPPHTSHDSLNTSHPSQTQQTSYHFSTSLIPHLLHSPTTINVSINSSSLRFHPFSTINLGANAHFLGFISFISHLTHSSAKTNQLTPPHSLPTLLTTPLSLLTFIFAYTLP